MRCDRGGYEDPEDTPRLHRDSIPRVRSMLLDVSERFLAPGKNPYRSPTSTSSGERSPTIRLDGNRIPEKQLDRSHLYVNKHSDSIDLRAFRVRALARDFTALRRNRRRKLTISTRYGVARRMRIDITLWTRREAGREGERELGSGDNPQRDKCTSAKFRHPARLSPSLAKRGGTAGHQLSHLMEQ
jgi:hypothetical protein